jgi:hypothetical protein
MIGGSVNERAHAGGHERGPGALAGASNSSIPAGPLDPRARAAGVIGAKRASKSRRGWLVNMPGEQLVVEAREIGRKR